MYIELGWILFSYLFASVPNGYLIPKWSSGEDIRTVGKKKLSASNVMRNVGFLPGILSGVLDLLKGTVAVLGARGLGLSLTIQAAAGILAVAGQMWPVFFKFWGGRGGAATLGAILALSPRIGLLALPIWPLAKIIGDRTKTLEGRKGSPLGMSLFIILIAIFGYYFNQNAIVVFGGTVFFIVHLQRVLGKPGSLFKIKNKRIILWRLLYDRDTEKY